MCRSSLWLDIENLRGESGPPIPVADLKRVFAGTRMVIYNSFGHRAGDPAALRYRAVIPFSCAVGVLTYEALASLAIDRCAAAGWRAWKPKVSPPPGRGVRYSGIDPSKVPATSIFYAPGLAANHEREGFFENVPGVPLDVVAWLEDEEALSRVLPAAYQPVQDPEPPVARIASGPEIASRAAKIDRAISEYSTSGRGTQNDGLFRLGWRLAGFGCGLAEIEAQLRQAAHISHSPGDRAKDVPRIIADIRRRKGGA